MKPQTPVAMGCADVLSSVCSTLRIAVVIKKEIFYYQAGRSGTP